MKNPQPATLPKLDFEFQKCPECGGEIFIAKYFGNILNGVLIPFHAVVICDECRKSTEGIKVQYG
jgi:uncharacterized protein with PIN domain